MPNYSKSGKILIPLTDDEFQRQMETGHFAQEKHRGFAACIYYYGVRVSEVLRALKEQFTMQRERIYFDVLTRLKHGKRTPPLMIPIHRSWAGKIWEAVEDTKPKQRVWPYSRMTGYNIIARLWHYPHHLRLTRITHLLQSGFTIPELLTYTGLSLNALNYYVGVVSIEKMGEV